jgi:hypothetical protein
MIVSVRRTIMMTDWQRYLRIALLSSSFEVLHSVGDFLLQNGFLANNKRDQLEVACLHGAMYTLPFAIFLYSLPKELRPQNLELILFVIFVSHVAIDHWAVASWYCRMYNWDWDTTPEEMHTPRFVIIECDQAMHKNINHLLLWL